MPVTAVACPHCETTFKSKTPVPEGTRLKCPKCAQPFVVPGAAPKPAAPRPAPAAAVATRPAAPKPAAAVAKRLAPPADDDGIVEVTEIIDDGPDEVVEIVDEGGVEAPARKGRKRAAPLPLLKRFPMWVWLTGGGVALLVVGVGCTGVAWLALSLFGGPSINKDNYDKIHMGASAKDVTAVMGQPNATADDLAKMAGVSMPSFTFPDVKIMVWKNGDNFMEVVLVKDKVTYKAYKVGSEFSFQMG